jgi:hypothetical protein
MIVIADMPGGLVEEDIFDSPGNPDPGGGVNEPGWFERFGLSIGRGLGSVVGSAAETAGIGAGKGLSAALEPLEVALLVIAIAVVIVASRVKISV